MKRFALILISIITLIALWSYTSNKITIAENQLESVNKNITEEQTDLIYEKTKTFPNNTQLSIAMVQDGETHFFGIQRINDSIYSIDNHQSVFEIGSVSKVFTSTLLANMVIDGEMELDDPITKYLDNELSTDEEIKLVELANHTSGFRRLPSNLGLFKVDPYNPYKDYGEDDLKQELYNNLKLKYPQGEQCLYSNLGAGTLGYILSQKTNMSYEELTQKYIFSKYNMTNSTSSRENIKNELVKGRSRKGEIVPNWDFDALAGAGAILSTTEDLSKFAIAQFDDTNEELALTRRATFKVNDNVNMGLGWHVLSKSNDTYFWHNGATGGYRSSIAVDVDNKNAVVILSNVNSLNWDVGNIDKLCFALIKTLKTVE